VLRAARLIKTASIELALLAPAFFHPSFTCTRSAPLLNGRNNAAATRRCDFRDRQVGTPFRRFAHQSHGDSHYNCFQDYGDRNALGFTKLGVQKRTYFFARGVMHGPALKVLLPRHLIEITVVICSRRCGQK